MQPRENPARVPRGLQGDCTEGFLLKNLYCLECSSVINAGILFWPNSMLQYSWPIVCNAGPTFHQHWVDVFSLRFVWLLDNQLNNAKFIDLNIHCMFFRIGGRPNHMSHPCEGGESDAVVKAVCLEGWRSRARTTLWPSLVKIQYCGEPPWSRGNVLGLTPPEYEFWILCLEGSIISFISPFSGGSPGPVQVICPQRWPKSPYIHLFI